jgi:hypothetical protein
MEACAYVVVVLVAGYCMRDCRWEGSEHTRGLAGYIHKGTYYSFSENEVGMTRSREDCIICACVELFSSDYMSM